MFLLQSLALPVNFQIDVAVLVLALVEHGDLFSDLATKLLNKFDVGIDALVERRFRPSFVLDQAIVHGLNRLKGVFDGAVLSLLGSQVGRLLPEALDDLALARGDSSFSVH